MPRVFAVLEEQAECQNEQRLDRHVQEADIGADAGLLSVLSCSGGLPGAGSPMHSSSATERLARLQQLVQLSGQNGLAVEIEMTEFEHAGPSNGGGAQRGPALAEYAGARDGAIPVHGLPAQRANTPVHPVCPYMPSFSIFRARPWQGLPPPSRSR